MCPDGWPSPPRQSAGAELALKRRLREGHCLRLMATTLIAALLLTINTTPSKADMNLKLYAYNLLTWQEFQCFNWLIHYESRWNPKARNGSHYGLGQMRSTWYRDLSPEAQIKASHPESSSFLFLGAGSYPASVNACLIDGRTLIIKKRSGS